AVWGTHWHGSLESDAFRRRFLVEVARAAGRRFVPAPDTSFGALREEQLDRLGDLVEEHADTDALWRLIEGGAPVGLPFVPPGAPPLGAGGPESRGAAPDPAPRSPEGLEMAPPERRGEVPGPHGSGTTDVDIHEEAL
ncbi:cobyric acid synthase, partial [Streptomyces sp. SID7499]|nr:cobyric acid synthase [Streptomyces sp. SID7499]